MISASIVTAIAGSAQWRPAVENARRMSVAVKAPSR
jgi:hypothetical protein